MNCKWGESYLIKLLSIEVDGETYKFYNNRWVDSMYCVAEGPALNKIYDHLIQTACSYPYDTVYEYARMMKETEHYGQASKLIDYLIEHREQSSLGGNSALHRLVPMKTSCLRSMNNPKAAIEFFNKIINEHNTLTFSSALYTSIAAAYCDVENYDNALKYAKIACALNTQDNAFELIYLIKRLKAVFGEDCFKN